MENIKIFEKHFRKGMINKDFDEFRRTHPRLLQCVLNAMGEVLPQANVSGELPPLPDKEIDELLGYLQKEVEHENPYPTSFTHQGIKKLFAYRGWIRMYYEKWAGNYR